MAYSRNTLLLVKFPCLFVMNKQFMLLLFWMANCYRSMSDSKIWPVSQNSCINISFHSGAYILILNFHLSVSNVIAFSHYYVKGRILLFFSWKQIDYKISCCVKGIKMPLKGKNYSARALCKQEWKRIWNDCELQPIKTKRTLHQDFPEKGTKWKVYGPPSSFSSNFPTIWNRLWFD